jgi:hypothetical protein
MELTSKVKVLLKEGARQLRGYARRLFMARAVDALGAGGQRLAQRELGWDRETIRKGLHELRTGVECVDGRCANGAKPADELWPNLRADLKDIVDSQSQTDPRFHTTRLYRRMSVPQVVVQLKEQKGYTELSLPANETIRTQLNAMGYSPSKVQKTKPKKKVPETDAIFGRMKQVVQGADASRQDETLRISIDTKAAVKIGPFRGAATAECACAPSTTTSSRTRA